MKTLKNTKTGEILRTDNITADKTVSSLWEFCPKSEWKKLRGEIKTSNKDEESLKKEKTKSNKFEHRMKLKEKQRD